MKKNNKRTINIKNERYLLFIDTETIGSLQVPTSVYPFEIGAKVYDTEQQKVVKEKSFLIRKLFNNKYIMLSTFSATKYPEYLKKIADNDKRYKTVSVKDTSRELEKMINRYNIKIMVAHNGNFDRNAIARLFEEFGTENPMAKLDLLDTMEVSKVITFSKEYADFCIAHKDRLNDMHESCFITNSGRVRTTAQSIYCFLSNNSEFQEAHTGLEDIDIEIEIFKRSMSMLGNSMVTLNTAPTWKDYSKVIVEEE